MNFQEIPWNNIVKFGQRTMLDTDLFSVSWILGRFCNYNCSYCWPYARSNTVDHQPLEIYKKTIDDIKTQAIRNGFNKFHWSFSGGEPTAYKNLLELINYLEDENISYQSLHMTTNLSPGVKWWKRWAESTKSIQQRSITASYHDEFANENEFRDKLCQLIYDGVYVTINQVMVPEKFYELYYRLERFANNGINVTLKPQSNTSATSIVDGYTDEMIDLMQIGFPQKNKNELVYQIELLDSSGNKYFFDQAERFNAYGFNQFKGWQCNSGYQSVIIRGNEVKRSYSCYDDILGTLDTGFKLFNTPQKCITNSCVSSADSKIPKCRSI